MNKSHQQHGSVYVMTLITIATISAMILVGISLRSSNNAKASFVENMSASSNATLDATEITLQTVLDDPKWQTTAQTGVALSKRTVNGVTYASTVIDADTQKTPTDTTTNFLLTMTATQDSIEQVSQLTIGYDALYYQNYVEDLTAEFYWPLTEDPKSTRADERIAFNDGGYLGSNAGAGTNDEGAPVPIFANSSDHVSVPWDDKFKQGDGSLSCWIKYTGPTKDYSFHPFLGMSYQSGGRPTFNAAIYNTAVWVNTSESGSYSVSTIAFTKSGAITPGTWHHITFVWGSDGLSIYVDGKLDGQKISNTDGVDTADVLFGGEQPLLIGAGYDFGDGGTPRKGFQGSVSHVVYYNHELKADEISELASIKPDANTSLTIIDESWSTVYSE